jgi:alanine dehydrogenase
VATSRPTTLNDPVFTVDEVLHYCVPNATASVARTTSYGLTNALLPYLLELGAFGMIGLLDRRPGFEQGINLYQGQLTNAEVAAALGRTVSAATPLGGAR